MRLLHTKISFYYSINLKMESFKNKACCRIRLFSNPKKPLNLLLILLFLLSIIGSSFIAKKDLSTNDINGECAVYFKYDDASNSDVYKVTGNCCIIIYNIENGNQATSGISFNFISGQFFNVTRSTQTWGYCQ
jgi:hypothetical protein